MKLKVKKADAFFCIIPAMVGILMISQHYKKMTIKRLMFFKKKRYCGGYEKNGLF